MAKLKDSGKTREFGTGAHRDASEGKGRCDLLPLGAVYIVLNSDKNLWVAGDTLKWIDDFIEKPNVDSLALAIGCFALEAKVPVETVILEAAKQYEDGANKYGANNWKHGIPLHVFVDSGPRHYLKWHRGDTDEPHDRAFVWNLLGAMWTLTNLPEMNDLTPEISAVTPNLLIEVDQK